MGEIGVLMMSWEYPPRIVGGIASHVYWLSKALVRSGLDVFVVTCDFPGAKSEEEVDGVKVFRVDSYRFPTPDFATWVAMMNLNIQMAAAELIRESRDAVDIIHAHDWLVAYASIGLKHMFRLPIVATIHSTEYGRRGGLHDVQQRMIHSVEMWLSREALKMICCSNYMASHVGHTLSVPSTKIKVISNGVDVPTFQRPLNPTSRGSFATPHQKLVLYLGRLVYEKGIHLLIEAVPLIIKSVDAKFVIVGEGYMKDELVARARSLGVQDRIYITGYLDSDMVVDLLRAADVVVVPSLYEPFGIVALEAMAAERPVVTTGVGGLEELVEHDRTGVKVYTTGESIASGVSRVLADREYAGHIARNALNRVRSRFSWSSIAEETTQLYRAALKEFEP